MAGMAVTCPPPARFRSAGTVMWAQFSPSEPAFAKTKKRRRGRRAQGIRYELKGHMYFERKFGSMYVASPWITFQEETFTKVRWCQPDALVIDVDAGILTILEFKLQHTSDAWWQLRTLYEPVLRKLFPEDLWEIRLVEVVRWFDPMIKFPEAPAMTPCITEACSDRIGVHIWKP